MKLITRPARVRRRGLLVAAAVAVAVLVLAGCGNQPSKANPSSAGASTTSPSAVAYSACMRAHGVPNFPDPASGGQLPKADAQRLGVSGSQLTAAQQACQNLLPHDAGVINAGSVDHCMMAGDCPRALVRQVLNEERIFAQCMRSRDVPNWPDPSIDSRGRPVFAISISQLGFNPYSPQVWAKGNQCSHLMPGLPGLPAAVSP
jgi:hypothetical protein